MRKHALQLTAAFALCFVHVGSARADGGCGSTFESWVCFEIMLILLFLPSLLPAIGGAIATWFIAAKVGGYSRVRSAGLSLLAIPAAFVFSYVGVAVLTRSLPDDYSHGFEALFLFPGALMVLSCLVLFATMRRWRSQKRTVAEA